LETKIYKPAELKATRARGNYRSELLDIVEKGTIPMFPSWSPYPCIVAIGEAAPLLVLDSEHVLDPIRQNPCLSGCCLPNEGIYESIGHFTDLLGQISEDAECINQNNQILVISHSST
jgi:hypothetical protein